MNAREDDSGRDVGIDLVRVLGVLAILAGHVWYTSDLAHRLTYSWHVPVFFLLAGYLWDGARSVGDELRRRWGSLLLPYVAWWLVVAAVYLGWAASQGHDAEAPLYYLLLAAWGGAAAFRPFTAFWFFTAFVTAVLFLRVVQHRAAAWAWTGAVLAVAACHLATPVALRSPLAVVQGVACVLFVLLGMQLRRVRPRIRRPGTAGLLTMLAGAALMALPPYRTLEIKSADFGTPVLSIVVAALIGAGLVLVAESLAGHVRGRPAIAVSTLAECSVVVILVHGVPMLLLGTSRTGSWTDFGIVAISSVGVALLVRLTPLSPALSGRSRLR